MFEGLRAAFLLSRVKLIRLILAFPALTGAGAVLGTLLAFEMRGRMTPGAVIDGVIYLSAGALLWLLPPLCSPLFASPGDLKAALAFPLISSLLFLLISGPIHLLTAYATGMPSSRSLEALGVSLLGVPALTALRFLLGRFGNWSYLIAPLPFLSPWWVGLAAFGAVWAISIALIVGLERIDGERRAGVWLTSRPPFRSPP